MSSATPRPFIDPSALNAAVVAAHAPGGIERLLFSVLGLVSRLQTLLSAKRAG